MILHLIFMLFASHAVCDYGLQTRYIAMNKDKHQVLFAHSMMHALGVYLVTQYIEIALFELVAHYVTDKLKVMGYTSEKQDQYIHYATKLIYVLGMYVFGLI